MVSMTEAQARKLCTDRQRNPDRDMTGVCGISSDKTYVQGTLKAWELYRTPDWYLYCPDCEWCGPIDTAIACPTDHDTPEGHRCTANHVRIWAIEGDINDTKAIMYSVKTGAAYRSPIVS